MSTLLNTKTKTDLIKTIQKYHQINKGTRLSKRVVRQLKLRNSIYEKELIKTIFDEEERALAMENKMRKKPKTKIRVDWGILEEKVNQIVEQWQRKQTEEIINQFLEEIKSGLKNGESIILRNCFSLGVIPSKRRKGINLSVVKKLKSSTLSQEEKNRLEANKEIIIPSQKRVRFKISSKLKQEINLK